MLQGVGIIGLLRQFEHIHRLGGAHQLEHFLFAVAGRLGDDQIRPLQKRIFPGDVIAEGGLDQRTQIGGQKLFGGGDGRRRAAAQADRHGAGGQDDFARREFAHDAHDGPACALAASA